LEADGKADGGEEQPEEAAPEKKERAADEHAYDWQGEIHVARITRKEVAANAMFSGDSLGKLWAVNFRLSSRSAAGRRGTSHLELRLLFRSERQKSMGEVPRRLRGSG
jgi:hypothetical protein